MNIKTKADLGRQIDWLASIEAKASGFCQLNYKILSLHPFLEIHNMHLQNYNYVVHYLYYILYKS